MQPCASWTINGSPIASTVSSHWRRPCSTRARSRCRSSSMCSSARRVRDSSVCDDASASSSGSTPVFNSAAPRPEPRELGFEFLQPQLAVDGDALELAQLGQLLVEHPLGRPALADVADVELDEPAAVDLV